MTASTSELRLVGDPIMGDYQWVYNKAHSWVTTTRNTMSEGSQHSYDDRGE